MSWFWGSSRNDESIDQIVDRLLSSTSASNSEIRSWINSISPSSKQRNHHETIGRAIPCFVRLLDSQQDTDISRAILEILIQICKRPQDSSGDTLDYIELFNTETLVEGEKDGVLLGCFTHEDHYVRYLAAQLFQLLIFNGKAKKLQDIVLSSQTGVSPFIELLNDHDLELYSEGIKILIAMSDSNQLIQKSVGYQGAFERLFEIIVAEGFNEGGPVVSDCLKLMNNLLDSNSSNQSYFKEAGFLNKLSGLFELQNTDSWFLTDHKISILLLSLRLISILVSGNNPSSDVNQTILGEELVGKIGDLGLSRINSVEIRTEALKTVGDLMKAHPSNRIRFAGLQVTLTTSGGVSICPSLLRLVSISLNSSVLLEQLAAAYAFQCYCYDNLEGQLAIASTLLPQPSDSHGSTEPTALGRHLVSALLQTKEDLKGWFGSSLLSSVLQANSSSKDKALNSPLFLYVSSSFPSSNSSSSTPGNNSTRQSLLGSVVDRLTSVVEAKKTLIGVGLLRLLCVWLDDYPPAVEAFISTNLPLFVNLVEEERDIHLQGLSALLLGICYLYTQNEASRSSLYGILQRFGFEKYVTKLDALRNSIQFINAEQFKTVIVKEGREPSESDLAQLYYDYDFTLFFKDAYDKTVRQLRAPYGRSKLGHRKEGSSGATSRGDFVEISLSPNIPTLSSNPSPSTITSSSTNSRSVPFVSNNWEAAEAAYKKQVKSLEEELKKLKEASTQQKETLSQQKETLTQQKEEISNLKTINGKLEKELNVSKKNLLQAESNLELFKAQLFDASSTSSSSTNEQLRAVIEEKKQLEAILAEKDQQLLLLKSKLNNPPPSPSSASSAAAAATASSANNKEVEKLRQECEQLQTLNAQLATTNTQLLHTVSQLKISYQQLHTGAATTRSSLANLQKEYDALAKEKEHLRKLVSLDASETQLRAEVTELRKKLVEQERKFSSLEKEQEELLVVLAGEEIQNNQLREQLASYQNKI